MNTASVTCTDLGNVTWLSWSVRALTDELAVFRVALSEGEAWLPYLRGLLSADEIERAARYRRPDDQLRFSCARGLLRVLLGRYTNQLPNQIDLVPGVNRKPELTWPTGWYFNVSHSGNWLLIAIGKVQMGVDLEWANPDFSFHDLLPTSFSPAERQYIASCPDARLGFYRLWTRKEALVKATAKGMADALDQIPSLTGTHPADAQLIGQGGQWVVSGFSLADGYPAAVAYEGASGISPQFYTLDAALALKIR